MTTLNPTAQKIFQSKYQKTEKETWSRLCTRVSEYVSNAEEEGKRTEYLARFYQMIYEQVFIPGGRILANAGTPINNLGNCYVMEVDDSRNGIYQTLSDAAEVFSQGGGIGYSFSNLREKGSSLSTGGSASGPIAFMELFDNTGELIQQHSRRAAQMGQLDAWHPDIFEFIRSKANLSNKHTRIEQEFLEYSGADRRNKEYQVLHKLLLDNQLTYFNISVMLDDKFMQAVEDNTGWDLISPKDGEVIDTVKARDLLTAIAQRAWESGDPGVGFTDRINKDNVVPYMGKIKASNPCGEIYMLSGESCVLGAINLHKFYDPESKDINFEFLEYVVRTGTRFLDDVVEQSFTGIESIDEKTKGLRRLGLGIMGWADLLAEMEVAYDSETANDLARYLSWFISFFSLLESNALAEEKGEFTMLDREHADFSLVDSVLHSEFTKSKFDLDKFKLRNVSVTTIAPTGSIAMLAGVNSGVEPFFMLAYRRNITEGQGNLAKDSVIEINRILLRKLKELGKTDEELELIKKELIKTGSVQKIKGVPRRLKRAFKTSHELDWKSHIDMQASWQKYVTNSISKTINFPNDATVKQMYKAIIYAWKAGLKGLAVYRDGSKIFQVLDKI